MALKNLISNIQKEKLRKQRQKTIKKVSVAALSGIAAGVASGVLLAPKSGKETRENIVKAALEANESLKNKTNEKKESMVNKGQALKSNATEAKDKIKDYLAKRKDNCCEEETECKDVEASLEGSDEEQVSIDETEIK